MHLCFVLYILFGAGPVGSLNIDPLRSCGFALLGGSSHSSGQGRSIGAAVRVCWCGQIPAGGLHMCWGHRLVSRLVPIRS